jgi:hypothetical protein
VRIKAGARAAAGSGATAERGSHKLPSRAAAGPDRLHAPANGQMSVPAESNVIVRFNAPMSLPTLVANLAFDPPITLTGVYSYFDPFSNEFFLGVSLKPSTNYRVRLGGAASDIFGATLGQDVEVRFTTGPLPPLVNIQTSGLVGTYKRRRPLPRCSSATANVTRLDFQTYRAHAPSSSLNSPVLRMRFENLRPL